MASNQKLAKIARTTESAIYNLEKAYISLLNAKLEARGVDDEYATGLGNTATEVNGMIVSLEPGVRMLHDEIAKRQAESDES